MDYAHLLLQNFCKKILQKPKSDAIIVTKDKIKIHSCKTSTHLGQLWKWNNGIKRVKQSKGLKPERLFCVNFNPWTLLRGNKTCLLCEKKSFLSLIVSEVCEVSVDLTICQGFLNNLSCRFYTKITMLNPRKKVKTFSRWLFLEKLSIVDARQGP